MDLQKLKSIYDAARSLNRHDVHEAAEDVGKSASMINQVLSGKATSKPTEEAMLDYCYRAGLHHVIEKQGLDPKATKENLANCKE